MILIGMDLLSRNDPIRVVNKEFTPFPRRGLYLHIYTYKLCNILACLVLVQ